MQKVNLNTDRLQTDSDLNPTNPKVTWLGRWYWLLFSGMLLWVVGMIVWLLLPHPQTVIELRPYVAQSLSQPTVESSDAAFGEEADFSASVKDDAMAQAETESPSVKSYKPKKRRAFAHHPKKPVHPPILNLNTANLGQLQLLPGIGPKMAERIIAYRKAHGGFQSVSEVMEVKGIGEKKFEKLKPYLKL